MPEAPRGFGSIIIFYDSLGQILLQERTLDAPRWPGYFTFFGGHREIGETSEETIRREFREELEYVLHSPQFLFKHRYQQKNYNVELDVFIEKYDASQELHLREGRSYRWVTIKEALQMKLAPHDMKILKKAHVVFSNII